MSFIDKLCVKKELIYLIISFVIIISIYFFSIYISKNNLSNKSEAAPNKIIGGTDAAPGEFPFFVWYQIYGIYNTFCGGTLIKPNLIVTAKHCVGKDYLFNKSFYEIHIMGNNDVRAIVNDRWFGHFLPNPMYGIVDEIIPYDYPPIDKNGKYIKELYNQWTADNDIMLIRLNRSFTDIKLPLLPRSGQEYLYDPYPKKGPLWSFPTKQNVTTIGFGINNVIPKPGVSPPYNMEQVGYTFPHVLQKIAMPIQISTISGTNNYFGFGFDDVGYNLNHTVSFGDSGGPILNGDYLIGVISKGYSGLDNNQINGWGIKIINYLQWIEDNSINNNSFYPKPGYNVQPKNCLTMGCTQPVNGCFVSCRDGIFSCQEYLKENSVHSIYTKYDNGRYLCQDYWILP